MKRKIILAGVEETVTEKTAGSDTMEAAGTEKPAQPQTIEEAFGELEKILEKLEDQDSPLEESFRYFERGMKLVKSCSAQIDKVEKQIMVLSEDEKNAGF